MKRKWNKKNMSLGLAWGLSILFVGMWAQERIQIREIQAKAEAFGQKLKITQRQATYVQQLREELHIPPKEIATTSLSELIGLMARLNKKILQDQKAPNPSFQRIKQISLSSGLEEMQMTLPSLTRYAYGIVNRSTQPIQGPILYQRILWDSTAHLIETAGFKKIDNETARAKDLWRFTFDHHHPAEPVTESSEEHDIVKFFSLYGYGLCDDSAKILARLADNAGLKGRFWTLDGHLVSEIYADGQWRMFDPNFGVFFHPKNKPDQVYSVQDLSKDPKKFTYASFASKRSSLSKTFDTSGYAQLFLTTENNVIHPSVEASDQYQIAYTLKPQEKIVFQNFNNGKFFLGKYRQKSPLFFNGFFEKEIGAMDFENQKTAVQVSRQPQGLSLKNPTAQEAYVGLEILSPFPLVGGRLKGQMTVVSGGGEVILADEKNQNQARYALKPQMDIVTDSLFAVLTDQPTYSYKLILLLFPQSEVSISALTLKSEFQFADLALLKLKKGANVIRIYTPQPRLPDGVEFWVDVSSNLI